MDLLENKSDVDETREFRARLAAREHFQLVGAVAQIVQGALKELLSLFVAPGRPDAHGCFEFPEPADRRHLGVLITGHTYILLS